MVWNRWLLAARTDRRGEGAHGEGRWIGTLALALALAVAGCAPTGAQHSFGNGARSPQAAPGASGRGAPEVDAPLVDPSAASAVELDAMLAYADRHAPALVVARSRRALGDAAVVAASPLLPDNPHIQLQGGPRFAGRAADVDFSVTLTQRLSVSGARGAGVAAAERFLELTEAEIEDARWVVHCDVHGAYHAALVARERAKLVLRGVTFQEGVLEVVKRQIAAGQSSPMNERLAEAELAQARQQSLAADQAYLEAKLALAELSGWPAANPPTPVGELELPHDVPPSDALFARAREHLPALRVYAAAVRDPGVRRLWINSTRGR